MSASEQSHRNPIILTIGMHASGARRVLIYDDDEIFAQECAETFARVGFTTETRAGRTSFLPLVADFAPDLLILDLHMPDFDGVEALRALRDYENKHSVSVILVSAADDVMLDTVASIARAYDIDLRGILKKPIKLADLRSVMTALVPHDKSTQI